MLLHDWTGIGDHFTVKLALRLVAGGCGWMVESCSYAVRIKYRTMHRTSVRRACKRLNCCLCCSPRTEDPVLRRVRAALVDLIMLIILG